LQKYQPINSFESPRFCGVRTFMRLPNKSTLTDVDFIVVGVPFDTGGSFRVGTRFGPQAIRDASILLRPYNPTLDVNIFDYCSGVDYGDIDVVPGYIEDSYEKIEEGASTIFSSGVIPIFLGGDHSVTLPELRAAAKTKGPVALVHFDSHSDTWDSYFDQPYNHGTPIRRAIDDNCLLVENSIQVGMRGSLYGPEDLGDAREMGLEVLTTDEVRKIGISETIKKIRARVQDKPVFVTFDIDFIDPAYAPGTGTPEIGGFTTWEAQHLVRESLRGINFVGFDVVEVLPSYDSNQITAFAGAGIVYEFVSLLALNKKAKE